MKKKNMERPMQQLAPHMRNIQNTMENSGRYRTVGICFLMLWCIPGSRANKSVLIRDKKAARTHRHRPANANLKAMPDDPWRSDPMSEIANARYAMVIPARNIVLEKERVRR